MILKQARKEGKTITAAHDSWASQAFMQFPTALQLQNNHFGISNVKSETSITIYDHTSTVSLEKIDDHDKDKA